MMFIDETLASCIFPVIHSMRVLANFSQFQCHNLRLGYSSIGSNVVSSALFDLPYKYLGVNSNYFVH